MRGFARALLVVVFLAGCGGSAEPATRGPATPATTPVAATGAKERGKASYYADKFEGRKTASGEPYRAAELTAAHRTLPFGAIVQVLRVSNGRSVEVRINDRGPHISGRILDLSRSAAEAIDLVRAGVADVELRVVSLPPPKPPKKRRK